MEELHAIDRESPTSVSRRALLRGLCLPFFNPPLHLSVSTETVEASLPRTDIIEMPGLNIPLLFKLQEAFIEKMNDFSLQQLFESWRPLRGSDSTVSELAQDFAIHVILRKKKILEYPQDERGWHTLLKEFSEAQQSIEMQSRSRCFTVFTTVDLMHQEIDA